ncbi:MAG: hypothetical protein AAGB26_17670 [Planctomycetota bacterium]
MIPFCFGGAILMVFLTSNFMPLLSDRYGVSAGMLIPLSALIGVVLGWFAMSIFFRLI